MKIEFNRPTIYMSHPIRGSTGDIEGNCKKASAAARRLRRVFPEVDFYVPAEHDLTLQILTADDRLTVEDVMYADLQILAACHGWMFYNFQASTGSQIEFKEACELKLTSGYNYYEYWFEYDIEKLSYEKLRKNFQPLITATLNRYRIERNRN